MGEGDLWPNGVMAVSNGLEQKPPRLASGVFLPESGILCYVNGADNEIVLFPACLTGGGASSHILLPSAHEIRQEAKGVDFPIGFGAGLDQRGEEQLRSGCSPSRKIASMWPPRLMAWRIAPELIEAAMPSGIRADYRVAGSNARAW
jgi:hypothetical protein